MESAWHPDPTGRHQHRWWDGTRWTEHASDNGVAVIDPLDGPAAPVAAAPAPVTPPAPVVPAAPVVPPAPVTPLAAPAAVPPPSGPPPPLAGPPGAVPSAVASTPSSGKGRRPLLIGAGIAAVVVIGGGAALLATRGGGGDDVPVGAHEETLASDSGYVAYRLRLERGDAIRFRVEPGNDLDAVVSIVADAKTAEADAEYIADNLSSLFDDQVTSADDVLEDFYDAGDEVYTRGEAEDEFGDSYVLQSMDNDSAGAIETDYYVSFGSGTYWLVVSSAEAASSDDFRLVVEQSDEQWVLDENTTVEDITDYQAEEFYDEEAFYVSSDPYETDE